MIKTRIPRSDERPKIPRSDENPKILGENPRSGNAG